MTGLAHAAASSRARLAAADAVAAREAGTVVDDEFREIEAFLDEPATDGFFGACRLASADF